MRQELNFWVVGGDMRQEKLAQLLAEDGHSVHTFALERSGAIPGTERAGSLDGVRRADCVVLPLPVAVEGSMLNAPMSASAHPLEEIMTALRPGQFLCGGKVTGAIRALAASHGLELQDYLDREELAVANAVPAALAVWAWDKWFHRFTQWSQAVAAYEGQGYSEKDAFWRAVRDQAASMGVSFAGGALSGGVMAGARVGIDAVDNTRQGAKLRGKDGMTQETYQAFVDEGLDSDPDSEAFRLAMQMQGKVDKKGKLSDYDLGRLYRANVAAIEAEGGMDTTEAEMGVEGEKTPPTAINTDPEGHTPEQQAVIEAYQADTDETLKEVFQGYLENPQQGFSRHNISSVSQRQAQDAQRLLGGDYAGYRNAINSNGIQHILGEHGPSGTVDHSMADLNDIARMAHVLDNYDNVEVVTYKSGDTDYSREFRDKNDRPAPMLKFSKRVDGTYYVIEAVPEARYKKFWVVSAYMEKADGGTQAPDANGPRTTPNASLASSPSASVDRVSQTPGNVNRGEVARRQKMVWEAAETGLGENGAKALRYVYNETLAAQVEPQDAYRDFCRVYTATLQGEKMEDGGIPETIRMAAEDSARQDLKAAMAGAGEESQTFGKPAAEEADLVEPGLAYEDAATAEYLKRMDPREVERLDRVTRALGARVRVVDSVAGGAANAQIRGNEILMDKHTKMDVVSYVLGHEFTHQIQDLAEGEYMAFREALDQETLRYAAEDIQAIYQKEGREIDLEAAMDEAAANMAGKLLEDGALLDEFIERNRENKTLLERMRDVIRAIWSKLTGAERRRAKTAEGKLTAALEAAAKNAKQGKTGGEMTERYLLKGVRADGIEVYETSREVREMPYKDRMEQFQRLMEEEYSGRTARFEADGEILYARFDSKDIAKNIYGDKRSDRKGWKAKINTGADGSIFDLVENAKYNGNSPELGKEGTAHKGVNEWAYFVKTVQIDGNVFDLVANVRKKESGEFVYSIQLRENKTISTSPVAVFAKGDPALKVGDADENNIPQPGDGVKPSYSLKGTERVEDAAELRRENEELREKYEYWKKQTRRSQAGKVSEEVMLRRTRGLLRDYGVTEATMDSRTVAHKLQAVYDDIGSGVDSTTGGEMTFRAAKERVRHYNRAAVEEALERMKAQGK